MKALNGKLGVRGDGIKARCWEAGRVGRPAEDFHSGRMQRCRAGPLFECLGRKNEENWMTR